MGHLHQRQGERTGLHTSEINGDESEPSAHRGGSNRRPQGVSDSAQQVVRSEFDAGDIPVVAHPQVHKTQTEQGSFGLLDLLQLFRCHGLKMRDA